MMNVLHILRAYILFQAVSAILTVSTAVTLNVISAAVNLVAVAATITAATATITVVITVRAAVINVVTTAATVGEEW